MDIAFWSSFRHKSGVTACVVAMSVLWSALYDEEIALTANYVSNDGLYECLHGKTEHWEMLAKRKYCFQYGEPEFFRQMSGSGAESEMRLDYGMRYIPMKGSAKSELFCGSGLAGVKKKVGEEHVLMIDTACGCSSSSQEIIQEAKLTVILLPSIKEMVDEFFQTETEYRHNSFFILNNYKETSSCTPEDLNKVYKISKERIGVIPYDSAFEQAMREGTTVSYLMEKLGCTRLSESYPFIRDLKKTARSLWRFAIKRRKMHA